MQSLPTRGAWIEISFHCRHCSRSRSRSPHGERGLKYPLNADAREGACRSPHGERGLKSAHHGQVVVQGASLPTRGAWIEMIVITSLLLGETVAPHTGSVD